jgi:hypothetical protein
MAETREGYWSKHHWAIVQSALALYVAVFATWDRFYPRLPAQIPNAVSATMPSGGGMSASGYVMPLWLWIGIIALVLSVAIPAFTRLLRGRRKKTASLQAPGIVPGIPSLSALLGQNPNVDFNAKQFFALAHYSPVTAEVEKNIRVAAQQNSPGDKEAFYVRLIGVGTVAYWHDTTWYQIFGSQLAALTEMNSRGLIPVADLKKHYDEAVVEYPKTYVNYSFEQWTNFMKIRQVVAIYPSQMAELSFGGKDFLKYLAHAGYNVDAKRN